MGISTSVAEFAGKIERAGAELKKQEKPATLKAARVLQRGAEAALNAAAPGGHLRNVKNSALSVRATSTPDGAQVSAVGKAYAILDNPTKGHTIGGGKGTKRAKGGIGPSRPGKRSGGVLYINGKFKTGPIHHPGTHGKHTFNIGTEAVTPEAFTTLIEALKLPMERVF